MSESTTPSLNGHVPFADAAVRLGLSPELERGWVTAVVWLERARALETELRTLQAGPIAGDAPQDAKTGPLQGDVAGEVAQTLRTSAGRQALAVRRWWRRIVGG